MSAQDGPRPGGGPAHAAPALEAEIARQDGAMARVRVTLLLMLAIVVLLGLLFAVPLDPMLEVWLALGLGVLLAVVIVVRNPRPPRARDGGFALMLAAQMVRAERWAARGGARPGGGGDTAGGQPGSTGTAPRAYSDLASRPQATAGLRPGECPPDQVVEVRDVFQLEGRGTVVAGLWTGRNVRVGQSVLVQRDRADVVRATVELVAGVPRFAELPRRRQVAGLLLAGVPAGVVARGDRVIAGI